MLFAWLGCSLGSARFLLHQSIAEWCITGYSTIISIISIRILLFYWFISFFDARALLSFPFPFLSSFSALLTLNSNHLVAWSQPSDNCQQLWNQWEYACQSWNLLRTLCTLPAIYANLPLSQIPPTQKIFKGLGPLVQFLHDCFPVLW